MFQISFRNCFPTGIPLAALALFLVLSCTAPRAAAQVPDVPGWDLFWHDEFDGTTLDTQKWTALDRRDSFNNEKQYYRPEQVRVANGNLEITAIDQPLANKAYRSGLITSNDLFGPGRFEARVDLPTSQGMWPAFWLNANHVPWPQGGEIDILENRGSQPNLVSSAYHWQTDPGPCCNDHRFVFDEYTATENGQPVDFHSGFHTYTAEWDETTVRYYVDGNLYHTVTETPDRPIFETAKNIIVNLAVGGSFGGDPDSSTIWPQTMLVDYVRVWHPSGEPVDPNIGANLLNNPGFDDNGGTLDGWESFGNVIPNVSASDALSVDGAHALKVFGQFNGQENFSGVSQGVAISGGESLIATAKSQSPLWDTLAGKNNDVTMKVEFYSEFGAVQGSSGFLGEVSQLIHDGSTQADIWHDHQLEVAAPADAVEARLSFVFRQPTMLDGAIWIDSASLAIAPLLHGDYNDNGVLDSADYTAWRDAIAEGSSTLANDPTPGTVDLSDYEYWAANYALPPASGQLNLSSVPEPASCLLLLVACFASDRMKRSRD